MREPEFSIDRDERDGIIHQCSNLNCYWVIRSKEHEPKCPKCGKRMILIPPFDHKLKGGL